MKQDETRDESAEGLGDSQASSSPQGDGDSGASEATEGSDQAEQKADAATAD